MDDADLLRRYLDEGAEAAFAQLVARRIGLVYSVALRKVGGDAHLAQEVAQAVFSALAKKAARLRTHPSLVGWLFTTTHFAATQVVRAERRRRVRETKAQAMSAPFAGSESEPDWEHLRPVLDDTVQELTDRDREAVLLRFYEGLTLREVGARLALTEEGARSRVDRALEKIRTLLERRGIKSTAAAAALALSESAGAAVPAGLAVAIGRTALRGAAGGWGTSVWLPIGATALIAAIGFWLLAEQRTEAAALAREIAALRPRVGEIARLRAENAALVRTLREVEALRADDIELARLRDEAEALRRAAGTGTRDRNGAAARPVVRINGRVQMQGVVPLPDPQSPVTLAAVLARAGGFAERASVGAVKVTRRHPDGSLRVFVLDAGGAGAGFVVQPDDIIYVPEHATGQNEGAGR